MAPTWCWKGIPFAKPPVGDLRWKAPKEHEEWIGTRSANQPCQKCSQYVHELVDGKPTGNFLMSGSEDCLYLNVWRPATQELSLPVYFWIHGGGNSIGSINNPMYEMDKLASRANVVVVTTQYRLGPFGWFIHESLQDDDPLNSSGNYGILDIIQALKWVQANIAAFGGNPKNITIAGESAGGINVSHLLISPAAKGLFHKAITESGGFFLGIMSPEAGKASAADAIKKILEKDGCTEENYEDCYPSDLKVYLMSKTPAEIFGGYKPGFAGMLDMDTFAMLFTDGAVISILGKEALNKPETYNQVPTILGTNKEEWKLFMFNRYGKMPDADYQAAAMAQSIVWKKMGVDDLAIAMSTNNGQPAIYAYQFVYGAYNEGGYNAWPTAVPNPAGGKTNFAIMLGAAHALEMPFFFGNWTYLIAPKLIFREDNKAGREALSKAMVGYLSSFVHSGTPSHPKGVDWKPWSNIQGQAKRIIFDANATQALIQMSNE